MRRCIAHGRRRPHCVATSPLLLPRHVRPRRRWIHVPLSVQGRSAPSWNTGVLGQYPGATVAASASALRDWLWRRPTNSDVFVFSDQPQAHVLSEVLRFAGDQGVGVEYVSMDADTSEAELKGSRELVGGHTQLRDGKAVRAALQGSILILDGVQMCSRGVLPMLNSLMEEARELDLRDGRMLVSADRLTAPLEVEHTTTSQQQQQQQQQQPEQPGGGCGDDVDNNSVSDVFHRVRLLPVHERFRVICIGLRGTPLDPPLRSRLTLHHEPPLPAHVVLPPTLTHVDPTLKRIGVVGDAINGRFMARWNPQQQQQQQRQQQHQPRKRHQRRHQPSATETEEVPLPPAFATHAVLSSVDRMLALTAPDGAVITEAQSELRRHLALHALQRAYPYDVLSSSASVRDSVREVLRSHELDPSKDHLIEATVDWDRKQCVVSWQREGDDGHQQLQQQQRDQVRLQSIGLGSRDDAHTPLWMIQSAWSKDALAHMMTAHASGMDMMLMHRVGKSHLAYAFASMLGYKVRVITCTHDTTSRDLFVRRSMDAQGNSSWEPSSLVQAAEAGDVLLLDHVERLRPGILESLNSLLAHRVVFLPVPLKGVNAYVADGEQPSDAQQSSSQDVGRIHPNFRIIGLWSQEAESTTGVGGSTATPNVDLQLWSVHSSLPSDDHLLQLLLCDDPQTPTTTYGKRHIVSPALHRVVQRLLRLYKLGLQSNATTVTTTTKSLVKGTFPFRLLRGLCRDLHAHANDTDGVDDETALMGRLWDRLQHAMTMHVLPHAQRTALLETLEKVGIRAPMTTTASVMYTTRTTEHQSWNTHSDESSLSSSSSSFVSDATATKRHRLAHLIPNPSFVNVSGTMETLSSMQTLLETHRSLLLLSSQGLGKNRLVDRLLHTLGKPRHYMQMHSDTTVEALTTTSALVNGSLVYSESVILQAMREGTALVLDEVDKASPSVIAVLRGLFEGLFVTPDGQVFASSALLPLMAANAKVERIHGDFCIIMLANPPTWPFHGTHVIAPEVPKHTLALLDAASLASMLHFHAQRLSRLACADRSPNDEVSTVNDVNVVNDVNAVIDGTHHHRVQYDREQQQRQQRHDVPSSSTLACIANAFCDLAVESARPGAALAYPYSVREAVRIVRELSHLLHLCATEAPGRGLTNDVVRDALHEAIACVFSLDAFDVAAMEVIERVLAKHGLPIDVTHMLQSADAAGSMPQPRAQPRRQVHRHEQPPPLDGGPKHGKVDPDNVPHVGGSTWAGGTGGSRTAGLGGVGGPYRLDAGHTVHQVSDEVKASISKEAAEAARKMGQRGLEKRLAEIGMSKREHAAYASYVDSVRPHVFQLRSLLQMQMRSRKQEQATWERGQTSGDLDLDQKLVEALSGAQDVYRRRSKGGKSGQRHEASVIRMRLVCDASASMYRFNGMDRRLERELQAVTLFMEALTGTNVQWDVVAHSGDSQDIALIDSEAHPENALERLRVLEQIVAHSQYTWPGDNTLESISHSIDVLAKERKHATNVITPILVCLSDANFSRYGIGHGTVEQVLRSGAKQDVHVHAIFIGQLGHEAEQLRATLSTDVAHIATDVADIPAIMSRILLDTLRSEE